MQPDKAKSAKQQEMERRANDLIRIYNPLDKRYVVKYDKRGGTKLFPIEAKSESVVVRYIADKYTKEMYNLIISKEASDAITAENERRVEKGMAVMDKTQKTGEQMQFETPYYMPNNEKAMKILSVLWVGTESEFGVDQVLEDESDPTDTRTTFEKSLEEIQTRKVGETAKVEKKESVKVEGDNSLVCDHPECGFEAKSSLGLISHKRKHRNEMENKKKEAVKNISK